MKIFIDTCINYSLIILTNLHAGYILGQIWKNYSSWLTILVTELVTSEEMWYIHSLAEKCYVVIIKKKKIKKKKKEYFEIFLTQIFFCSTWEWACCACASDCRIHLPPGRRM